MFSKIILIGILISFYLSAYLTFDSIKSLYGIGFRVPGDHLIVKDVLQSPITYKPRNHTLTFEYPLLNKVVSYIELGSNSNAYAEFTIGVDEKYGGGKLVGSATAIQSRDFNLQISVFGFNSTDKPDNFQSIIHPEIGITGEMKPKNDLESDEIIEYDDYDERDTVKEIGDRQPGDYLLYEKLEHIDSDIRNNKTLTFYYIDSDYVTYAKFLAIKTKSAGAIYSKITENSLKAIIYDINKFSLAVRCEVYGYKPADKPIDYYPPVPLSKQHQNFKNEFLDSVLTGNLDLDAELPPQLNNLVDVIKGKLIAEKNVECKCNKAGNNFNISKINLIIGLLTLIHNRINF